MELHKAIDRVAKLAAKGKGSPQLYQTVRLIPAEVTLPDRVFATDGLVSSIIPVDQPLPDALLPVDAMRKVAKSEIRSVELVEDQNEVWFHLVAGGKYRVKVLEQRGYPFPTTMPHGLVELDYWKHIKKAIHAAAGEKGKGGFQAVMFGPKWVGATDTVRVAVVDAPGWGEPRLVPAGLFKTWPAGKVEASITHTHAFFKVGDEVRVAPVQGGSNYPDLKAHVGDVYEGAAMVLPTKRFLESVKRATAVSPTKTVVLQMRAPELRLKSWSTSEGGKGYSAVLAGPGGYREENPVTVVVNGTMLTGALTVAETPRVRLCYAAPHKPIRLESGPFVEEIHPWRV